ncbi:MAG TPA: hypothetical protein VF226_13655 [Hyphomicrobiaceae bacterium]
MPATRLKAVCVRLINAGVVLAALAVPWPASGQSLTCIPRDLVLKNLADNFQEAPVGVGLASNGVLLELLTSPDGSTWTVILSAPNGMSCPLAAGRDWQDLVAPERGDPA